MASISEWQQSAVECGRRADEALAAKNYAEARRWLGRAKRHALCAARLQAELAPLMADVASYDDWFVEEE